MTYLAAWLAGIACGAGAWGLGSVLSGTFEPFDSLTGFLTTQAVLGAAALVAGRRYGTWPLLAVVSGGYVGLNLYSLALGGPESQAWAALGALTTLALLVLPLLLGVAGVCHRRWRRAP